MLRLQHLTFQYDFSCHRFSAFTYLFSMPVEGKERTLEQLTQEYRWIRGNMREHMGGTEERPRGVAKHDSLTDGVMFLLGSPSFAVIEYELGIGKADTISEAHIRVQHDDTDNRRLLAVYDQISGVEKSEQAAAAAEKIAVLRKEGTPHAYISLLK